MHVGMPMSTGMSMLASACASMRMSACTCRRVNARTRMQVGACMGMPVSTCMCMQGSACTRMRMSACMCRRAGECLLVLASEHLHVYAVRPASQHQYASQQIVSAREPATASAHGLSIPASRRLAVAAPLASTAAPLCAASPQSCGTRSATQHPTAWRASVEYAQRQGACQHRYESLRAQHAD